MIYKYAFEKHPMNMQSLNKVNYIKIIYFNAVDNIFRQQDMCEYIFVNLCPTAVETTIYLVVMISKSCGH